jgi:hypothetical protein
MAGLICELQAAGWPDIHVDHRVAIQTVEPSIY